MKYVPARVMVAGPITRVVVLVVNAVLGTTQAVGVLHPVPLVAHYGLALAPRIFGEETASALAANATWSAIPLLALAIALGVVALRAQRSAAPAARGD